MNKHILIWGKGFIGERLKEELGCPHTNKIIKTFKDAETVVNRHKPKIILSCVGYTGAGNVDGCEKALDQTLQANTYVPLILAEIAVRRSIKLIHLSSGCIYHFKQGRQKPISETRLPDYYDLYYSRTKIYAEDALAHLARYYNILIIRLRIPLDKYPHPKNILNKLLSFDKIIDTYNSVTYIPDFIKAVRHLINIDARGIYNIALKDGLNYVQLLNAYNKYAPRPHPFKKISLRQLNMKRTNLLLSTRKLERSGFNVRRSTDIFEECVKTHLKYS